MAKIELSESWAGVAESLRALMAEVERETHADNTTPDLAAVSARWAQVSDAIRTMVRARITDAQAVQGASAEGGRSPDEPRQHASGHRRGEHHDAGDLVAAEDLLVGADLRGADLHESQQLIASLSAKIQALLEMNRELEAKMHERTHELADANARLAQLAVTDGLTGLYNHLHFHERLALEVERSQRSGLALSLLMLDVDHFKQFNDTFGHPAGDEVLRQLARVLADARRDGDVVARYGGEEFAVILVDTTKFTAAEVAEQIRERVFAHDFSEAAQRAGRIGVSIGVATLLDDGGDAEALVRAADTALYAAKRAGRNRVVLATETLLAAPG